MGDESLLLGDSRLQQLTKKKTVIFADKKEVVVAMVPGVDSLQ
jgi:hypothetical protein